MDLTAPDKMDYLDAIPIAERSGRPVGSSDDVLIYFDGYSLRGQR